MTTKFSINTQLMAIDLAAIAAKASLRKSARPNEAEYMVAAYEAARNTLGWIAEHEAEIREWVNDQRALDARSPRE